MLQNFLSEYLVATAVFTFAAVIIAQQFLIMWQGENEDSDWEKTSSNYIRQRYLTSWISMIVAMLGICLSLLLIFSYDFVADQYVVLFKKENLVAVFGIGLLAAIFRHLIDRQIEQLDAKGRVAADDPSGANKWHLLTMRFFSSNIWLFWFLASYVFTVVLTAYGPTGTSSDWAQTTKDLLRTERKGWVAEIGRVSKELDTEKHRIPTVNPESNDAAESVSTLKQELLSQLKTKRLEITNSKSFLTPSDSDVENLQALLKSFRSELLTVCNVELTKSQALLDAAEAARSKADATKDAAEEALNAKPDEVQLKTQLEAAQKDLELKEQDHASKEAHRDALQRIVASKIEFQPVERAESRKWKHNKLPSIVIALAIWLILWFSWHRWVHSRIRSRLRDFHRFRGPAVNEFMSMNDSKTPRQLIVIGPKGSGKTELVCQWAGIDYVGESLKPRFFKRTQGDTILSICDMPGENVGDQITYLSNYRVDWLVVVLRANSFRGNDPESDEQCLRRLKWIEELGTLPDACVNEASFRKDANDTRDYFTALKLILKQEHPDSQRIFSHVKNILLVLNFDVADSAETALAKAIHENQLKGLASDLVGRMNGMPHLCEHAAANVQGQANSLLAAIVRS